ncbi:MAG: (2Fe-2S)-binding protein [Pseudomonadales bacterium]|nr:(2Fe-2S)-binding protein [Pseudomonadales bacterium]NRA16906.1 (2Fe-2S)-binding protein [Oceanospirillaceae bacterium]
MDITRKQQTPGLVCTCNDLYAEEIAEITAMGETEYKEIFALLDTQPRCGECVSHVNQFVSASDGKTTL